jgi:uncharacterized damage-inducible protein DinB
LAAVGQLFIEAFRYHKWANGRLLEECARLSDEQLEWTAPGTYGTVARTWLHLLGAEQRYIQHLGGSQPRFRSSSDFPGLETVTSELARSDDELIELAGRFAPEERIEPEFDDGRFRLPAAIVLIQALHHGNDHRTHICTILGHHDVTYGDVDVWAYGDATGVVEPVNA